MTKCLERIRYSGPIGTSVEILRRLQESFLLSVPFENLDIHLGRHIEFSKAAVYRKVVQENRGGFCYELNSFFHDILVSLGFRVHMHGARMIRADGVPGAALGHMVLTVEIGGGSWMADVGNGKSFRTPLSIESRDESWAEGVGYRVASTDAGMVVQETGEGGVWRNRFIFDPRPRGRAEFVPVCEWTQKSPASIFTQRRVCTIARPDGRATLLNQMLTITESGRTEEREIPPEEWGACLRSVFGIELPL